MSMVIDVSELSKTFAGKLAVDKIDLQVAKGEVYGFLGPNGSGKTTTIRMLCGLMRPSSGKGLCLGYDVLTEYEEIKKHVGYMPQRFSYYLDLTVAQNLKFVGQMYQVANLSERMHTIMSDFDLLKMKNQLVAELSGGWKQRVSLAAALIHKPKLLLLDEPTAGVDPEARRYFWEVIHNLAAAGTTALVSTHYMDEAQRCTRLAYIIYGKLIASGKEQEIIQQAGLITWSLTGGNIADAYSEISKNNPEVQVAVFGNSLHVSGEDAGVIEKIISGYTKNPDYKCQQIEVSIEDVFIYFVRKYND